MARIQVTKLRVLILPLAGGMFRILSPFTFVDAALLFDFSCLVRSGLSANQKLRMRSDDCQLCLIGQEEAKTMDQLSATGWAHEHPKLLNFLQEDRRIQGIPQGRPWPD